MRRLSDVFQWARESLDNGWWGCGRRGGPCRSLLGVSRAQGPVTITGDSLIAVEDFSVFVYNASGSKIGERVSWHL